MRVYCYQSWTSDPDLKQALWLCSDSFGAGPIDACNRYYIREDRLSFALLIDPSMRHIKEMDYYL
jgi:hypothetical protein